jgi:hypothetical protein
MGCAAAAMPWPSQQFFKLAFTRHKGRLSGSGDNSGRHGPVTCVDLGQLVFGQADPKLGIAEAQHVVFGQRLRARTPVRH